jgi:hypothetical protein
MSATEQMVLMIKAGFWISLIGVALRIIFLGSKQYPRTVTYNANEDTVLCVLSMMQAAYFFWLAWGHT